MRTSNQRPHAPFHPGPRPGTWHKTQRYNAGTLALAGQLAPRPPVYTRPQPKRQHLGERSFHPGMMRIPPKMRGWVKQKRTGLKGGNV